jgi:hypothetical protein
MRVFIFFTRRRRENEYTAVFALDGAVAIP